MRGRLAVLRAASALRSSSRWRLAAFLGWEVLGAFGGVGWGGDGVGWVAVWGFPVPGSTRVGRGEDCEAVEGKGEVVALGPEK